MGFFSVLRTYAMTTLFLLNGGLDLTKPALAADPGTLTDCMNFERAVEDGYRRCDGVVPFDGIEVDFDKGIQYEFTAILTYVPFKDLPFRVTDTKGPVVITPVTVTSTPAMNGVDTVISGIGIITPGYNLPTSPIATVAIEANYPEFDSQFFQTDDFTYSYKTDPDIFASTFERCTAVPGW